jgi:hypothetical protein
MVDLTAPLVERNEQQGREWSFYHMGAKQL